MEVVDNKTWDDKFYITGGSQADNDGIAIASSRVQGELIFATKDESGTIEVKRYNKSISELNEEQEYVKYRTKVNTIYHVLQLIIFVICIAIYAIFKDVKVSISLMIFIMVAVYTKFIMRVPLWIAIVIVNRPLEQKRRYNEVLHKAMNAMRNNKKIPTIEEMKKESRYSNHSALNDLSREAIKALFDTVVLCLFLIPAMLILVNIIRDGASFWKCGLYVLAFLYVACIIKFMLAAVVPILDDRFENLKQPMRIMQDPFFAFPSDGDYELVRAALEGYEKMEQDIDENADGYQPESIELDAERNRVVFHLVNHKRAVYTYSEFAEFLSNMDNLGYDVMKFKQLIYYGEPEDIGKTDDNHH